MLNRTLVERAAQEVEHMAALIEHGKLPGTPDEICQLRETASLMRQKATERTINPCYRNDSLEVMEAS